MFKQLFVSNLKFYTCVRVGNHVSHKSTKETSTSLFCRVNKMKWKKRGSNLLEPSNLDRFQLGFAMIRKLPNYYLQEYFVSVYRWFNASFHFRLLPHSRIFFVSYLKYFRIYNTIYFKNYIHLQVFIKDFFILWLHSSNFKEKLKTFLKKRELYEQYIKRLFVHSCEVKY